MAHPLAGKPAPSELLVDVADLVRRYYADAPDPANPAQRVAFGTSGHRGSSLRRSFNEAHILAVAQAICEHRASAGVDRPALPRHATPTRSPSPPCAARSRCWPRTASR